MSKKVVRLIAIILAILMVMGVLTAVIASRPAKATVTQSSINSKKAELEQIKQRKQEIKSELASVEYEQYTALAKKQVLDEQMTLTQEEIDIIDAQIAEYDVLITEKGEQLNEAIAEEDAQFKLYQERLRAMEENGTISYYSIFLGAADFSDFLSRVDFVSEIIEYDELVYDELLKAREATECAKAELEEARSEQEDMRAVQVEKQEELAAAIEEAAILIEQLEDDYATYEALYDEIAAEEYKVQQEVNKMVAEYERSQTVKGTGTFIWPSAASRKVTSPYGTRLHPIFKTYRFHSGIDIGASYGSQVLAADGGTVTTAGYSSSYGNYVVIYHGNNMTTLYAHMSKLYVKKGDTVKQGSVIGLVGSTGNSTGPHLHFEIRKNGSTVNPLDYYTNYTKAY